MGQIILFLRQPTCAIGDKKIIIKNPECEIVLDREIGKGARGIVYSGELYPYGEKKEKVQVVVKQFHNLSSFAQEIYAIKKIEKHNPYFVVETLLTMREEFSFEKEIRVAHGNEEPNFFVVQRRENCNCEHYKIVESPELLHVMLGACFGVKEMHDAGIIHQDIKPANILIRRSKDYDTGGHFISVLGDLGIACEEKNGCQVLIERQYAPPERLVEQNAKQSSKAVDIWGLGMSMVLLLTGKTIFESLLEDDENELSQNYHVIKLSMNPQEFNKYVKEQSSFYRLLNERTMKKYSGYENWLKENHDGNDNLGKNGKCTCQGICVRKIDPKIHELLVSMLQKNPGDRPPIEIVLQKIMAFIVEESDKKYLPAREVEALKYKKIIDSYDDSDLTKRYKEAITIAEGEVEQHRRFFQSFHTNTAKFFKETYKDCKDYKEKPNAGIFASREDHSILTVIFGTLIWPYKMHIAALIIFVTIFGF